MERAVQTPKMWGQHAASGRGVRALGAARRTDRAWRRRLCVDNVAVPALALAALALLAWNLHLVLVLSSPRSADSSAAQTLIDGADHIVDVSTAATAALSPRLDVPPRAITRELVSAELRATHSWARTLVAANRRLIRSVQATSLPAGTVDASKAAFRPLLHTAEAALRSTIAVDAMLARTAGGDPTRLLLTPSPKIFCVIPTAWPRDEFRVVALEATWGKHCDFLKFAVAKSEHAAYHLEQREDAAKFLVVDTVNDQDPNKRNIWEKSWRMWLLVSEQFGDVADFYVKTDTDAFLMVENLRGFVRHLDSNAPHYVGHTMMQRWGTENVKFNVGAGYIISRASLRLLGGLFKGLHLTTTDELTGARSCVDRAGAGEDPTMGICMRDLGLLPENSLDLFGRQRFLPFKVVDHLNTFRTKEDWFWAHKTRDVGIGRQCCSSFPIMFHNYKEEGDSFRKVYQEVDYFFTDAVSDHGDYRYVEPPDNGLYRFDPDTVRFERNAHRDACRTIPSRCRTPPPVTLNKPAYKVS